MSFSQARPPGVEGPLIDIDQHFNEISATWRTAQLPPDRRLVLHDDNQGERHLYFGDRRIGPGRATRADEYARIEALVEKDDDAFERELRGRRGQPRRYEDVVDPSISSVSKRLEAMRNMATDVSVQFPSYGFYWPERLEKIDLGAVHPHMVAWNRWIADECRGTAGQILGVGQTGWYDAADAAAEIYRCADDGLCGLVVGMRPYRGLPWSDRSNEPIWRAFAETGLVLFLHTSLMSHSLDPAWELADPAEHSGPDMVTMVNRSAPAEAVLTDLVFGGVLERFSALRIAVVECGTLWVESYLQRIDWAEQFLAPRNKYLRRRFPIRPSEYVTRQVRMAAFPFEPVSRFFVDQAPDLLMYSSDFPHDEGTRVGVERLEQALDLVGADTGFRQKFYVDNARALLGRKGAERCSAS